LAKSEPNTVKVESVGETKAVLSKAAGGGSISTVFQKVNLA